MKKTIPFILLMFLFLSCENQDTIEQPASQSAKLEANKTEQFINAPQIYYLSALFEINEIENKQNEILALFDNENWSEALEQEYIENNRRIKTLQYFTYLIIELPGGPILPPPPPPGCLSNTEANCIPSIDMLNVKGVVLSGLEVDSVKIVDPNNNLVGEGTEVVVINNEKVMLLDFNFNYDATMYSTIFINDFEITIKTPVSIN